MASLTFRARAIDMAKPLPIMLAQNIPDLAEATSVQRALPQMATGMDKEEEEEHHIQVVISAQHLSGSVGPVEKVIPTPEANTEVASYKQYYTGTLNLPKNYIQYQDRYVMADMIEYDLDTEDEQWLSDYNKNVQKEKDPTLLISDDKLESMLDKLESVTINDILLSYEDAKGLLKEDGRLAETVYFYWKEKRVQRNGRPLRPTIKTESRFDSEGHFDPYVAFRRRADKQKIQTRKNRQRDEIGYERMIKLQKDMERARSLVELLKKREVAKCELMAVALEVFQKRYETDLWDYPSCHAQDIGSPDHTHQSDMESSFSKFKKHKIRAINGHSDTTRPGKITTFDKLQKYGNYTQSHEESETGGMPKMLKKADMAFPFKRKRGISYCQ
eukprot:Ihof_evm20s40 gene=Ihof_evmTU20s40